MAGRSRAVLCTLFLTFLLGTCKESGEETKETFGNNYEEIFHNMPALFEYLLEMLEEKPEILEKDDVTYFQDMAVESYEGEVKREANQGGDDCSADEDDKLFKRNAIDFTRHENTDNDANTDWGYTTEYSPRTVTIPEQTITTVGFEDKHNIIKVIQPGENLNIQHAKSRDEKILKAPNERKAMKGKKRNVLNLGDSIVGSIDWSKLYLSPEEVEEQAIKVQHEIEDHNKKKNDDRE